LKAYEPQSDPLLNLLSWDGFTSAAKTPEKAIQNLSIYGLESEGGSRVAVLFIIMPDSEDNGSDCIFPADVSKAEDCIAAYVNEKEVLYPIGQQFELVKKHAPMTMEQLACFLKVNGDHDLLGCDEFQVRVIEIKAVDKFYEFAEELFVDGCRLDFAVEVLSQRLSYERARHDKGGETHCLYHLGNALRHSEKHDESLECYNHALTMSKLTFGKEHPHTAKILHRIGALHFDCIPDHEKALNFFEQAAEIQDNSGLDFAETLDSLGNLCTSKREMNKAFDYLSRSLHIKTQVLGNGHARTSKTLLLIGNVFLLCGQNDNALDHYLRALGDNEVDGEPRIELANALFNIAMIYFSKQDKVNALKFCRSSLRHYEGTRPNFWTTQDCQKWVTNLELELCTHHAESN